MAIFNQTFFDLNQSREYCFEDEEGLPQEVISDLKLSIAEPVTGGIYLQGVTSSANTFRLVFTTQDDELLFSYTSNSRTLIFAERLYPLTSYRSDCAGVIAFGDGIKKWTGSVKKRCKVSEECLTRFVPSKIPFVAATCDADRLTGEVKIAGTEELVQTVATQNSIQLLFADTKNYDLDNPIVRFANGINQFFESANEKSPILQLFGAYPDEDGKIYVNFDDHFQIYPIATDNEHYSELAIGSDVSVEEVCALLEAKKLPEPGGEPEEDHCDPSQVKIRKIEFEE